MLIIVGSRNNSRGLRRRGADWNEWRAERRKLDAVYTQ
jgi:hypothetical protein